VSFAGQLLRCTLFALSVAMVVGFAGCNTQRTAPVSGNVTYEGNPVPEGTITFFPREGGRPATGTIHADGTYVLSSMVPGDGVPPGEYAVAIEARRVHDSAPMPTSLQEEIEGVGQGAPPPKIEWLVPINYSSAETSGLTATVEPGKNVIDFALP